MVFESFTRRVISIRELAPPSLIFISVRPIPRHAGTGQVLRRQAHREAKETPMFTPSHPPSQPPDPASPPPPQPNPSTISDHEWNLRAGRAVYTLRTTMPKFFETGLVSSVDPSPPTSDPPSRKKRHGRGESIYAPNIRLSYTPPASLSLPSPFPKSLQVEGLPLYHASATFIRHTLSAFNTDLHVELRKLQVRSPGPRHREITMRKGVSGKSRISGARNEWDVHSTYTLSPQTGLIESHVVESIQPAPHVTFYDGLRAALARLAGVDFGREEGAGVRGFVVDRSLESIPLREEVKKSKDDD